MKKPLAKEIPMMIPFPQSGIRQLREAIPTPEEAESARVTLELTNGNAAQTIGVLRQTLPLPQAYAAVRAALGK